MFQALAFCKSYDKGLSLKMSALKVFMVANFHNQCSLQYQNTLFLYS